MKTFQSLTQRLLAWRSRAKHSRSSPPLEDIDPPQNPPTYRGEKRPKIPPPVMLIFAIASLTTAIGYRFYNQPRLREGTIAPKTIWATRDATVVDKELTEEHRKAVQTGLVKVLTIDNGITQQIREQLNTFLAQVEQMRQMAGSLPFEDDRILSLPTQRYLRSTTPEEWQGLADTLKKIFSN